jgi:hypothetical protein
VFALVDIVTECLYVSLQYCFPPQRQVIDACAALAEHQVFRREDVKVEPHGDNTAVPGDTAATKLEGLTGWLQPSIRKEGADGEVATSVKDVRSPDRVLVVVG